MAVISASSLINRRVKNSFFANYFSMRPKYLLLLIRLVLRTGFLKLRYRERDLLLDFLGVLSALLLLDYLSLFDTAGKMKENSSCFT